MGWILQNLQGANYNFSLATTGADNLTTIMPILSPIFISSILVPTQSERVTFFDCNSAPHVKYMIPMVSPPLFLIFR